MSRNPELRGRQTNKSPIKVLFVLPSLLRGGAEVQVVNLANGLSPDQFESYLATFEKHLDQKDRIDGRRVAFSHFMRKSKFDMSPVFETARLIDTHGVDIVHCSLQIALLVGWLSVRYSKRKPKLILALHTTLNRNLKNEVFDQLLYQWLMRDCAAVICVCHAQEKHWHRRFQFLNGKTRVVYNGVDTTWFDHEMYRQSGKEFRDKVSIPVEARVICHVAGFRPEKGHAILLDAFGRLIQRDSNVYLIFVGDGALRPEIEERVRSSNLTSHVRFLGNLADVRPALAGSDCSVLPSTAETFSIAMLESFAMGVPIVATNIGGAAEAVVDYQTGFLVPAGDAAALSDALHDMLENNVERRMMGIAGRNLVMSKFSSAMMISETERVLTEVVNG